MSADRPRRRGCASSSRPDAAPRRSFRRAARGVLLAAALLPRPAAALDPGRALTQYAHDAWGTANGLPQSTGLSLARTRDGFLWVGTEEGIARFDGSTFTVRDRRNTPGLPHNIAYALLGARDGSLWVGTASGLARLVEGSARPFGAREKVPETAIRALAEGRDGSVWAATRGGGLVRIRDEAVTVLTKADGLPSDEVSSLLEEPDGSLWIATAEGLAKRRPDGTIEAVPLPGAASARLRGLARGRDGALWVGSDAGLLRVRGGAVRSFGVADGLASEKVHAVASDRDGNVWVATASGLCRIAGAAVACLVEKGPITPSPVFPILEDDAGDLWFGAAGSGLHRLSASPFLPVGRPEGLPTDVVLCFLEARDGRVWVGTYGGGVAVRDGDGWRVFSRANGLPDDTVVGLHEDRAGVVWAATKGGLAAIDGGAVRPGLVPRGLPSDDLYAVAEDGAGTLWVASDAGLSRREGSVFRTLGEADGLAGRRFRMMTATPDGSIWAGFAGGGLARVRDGKVALFGRAEGLPDATFYALRADADGTLWGGTLGGGLVRGRDGRFRAYTTSDGLEDDTVYEVVDDGLGSLWLTSNRGIVRVARADLAACDAGRTRAIAARAFGVGDGLRSAECNGAGEPSALRARDGRLWFATLGGAAVLDPGTAERPHLAAVPRVEAALVDGRPIPHVVAGVAIPAGREALEIRYVAPVFRNPERARFRYRLAGFDAHPVEAGTRRSAIYTNLSPGLYEFTVAVSVDGAPFGPPSVPLAVRVEPRLHQTRWFLALCLAAVVAVAAGLHAARVRLLASRARELEHVVRDRTAQLRLEMEKTAEANRAKSQFLANVTHDLRTPLNAIIGYADLLAEQAEERQVPDFVDDLGRIRRAAEHQLALVNDVLDLAKVEAGRLDVALAEVDLTRLLSDVLATVGPMVRRNGSRLEAEGLEAAGTIRTDPTRLRQILLNLLSNAARHTPEGLVAVEVAREDGDVLIRVRDTGVGIPEEEIALLFQAFSQARGGDARGTGLGLAISQRLAGLLGGEITVESAAGRGSTFTLRLPAGPTPVPPAPSSAPTP
jgi:signal transduction histidine kinase/ligand-binding sensor domain-containing protein